MKSRFEPRTILLSRWSLPARGISGISVRKKEGIEKGKGAIAAPLLFVLQRDFIREETNPQQADEQPTDNGKEPHRTVVFNTRRVRSFCSLLRLEMVEHHQRDPGNRQRDGETEFRDFGT